MRLNKKFCFLIWPFALIIYVIFFLQDLTGIDDIERCRNILDSHHWDLEVLYSYFWEDYSMHFYYLIFEVLQNVLMLSYLILKINELTQVATGCICVYVHNITKNNNFSFTLQY